MNQSNIIKTSVLLFDVPRLPTSSLFRFAEHLNSVRRRSGIQFKLRHRSKYLVYQDAEETSVTYSTDNLIHQLSLSLDHFVCKLHLAIKYSLTHLCDGDRIVYHMYVQYIRPCQLYCKITFVHSNNILFIFLW